MKFDAKTIAALALPDGKTDHTIWFEPGFGLRLRRGVAGVSRSWTVGPYRANGRQRRASLSYDRLSPTEAREKAREILAHVELGGDPQGDRAATRRKSSHTVKAVAEEHLEAMRPDWSPNTYRVKRLYLLHGAYFKALHHLAVTEVTHPDVAARISAIKRTNGTVTAMQALSALSTMFDWAIAEGRMGLHPVNPVVGAYGLKKQKGRDRVLNSAELAAVWYASGDDEYGCVTKLCIALGARRSEVGGMQWSEIDLGTGTWTLPGSRSKNGRAHEISLPPVALALIEALPRHGDHLFGRRGFRSWDNGKRALDLRLGDAVKPWRLHDLRRSFATGLADLGVQPHVIEACLNHYTGRSGISGVYNKSTYARETKAAFALWGEHLTALVEGRKRKVVALNPHLR